MVFKARHLRMDRTVALKILSPALTKTPELLIATQEDNLRPSLGEPRFPPPPASARPSGSSIRRDAWAKCAVPAMVETTHGVVVQSSSVLPRQG